MGFLSMPDPEALDMAKVTISLWFRFPASTIDRVNANPPPRGGANGYSEAATWPVLQWQLTLLSWGDQIQGKIYWPQLEQVGLNGADAGGPIVPPVPIMGLVPSLTQTGPMAPSYIGLDFKGELADQVAVRVVVNLQGSKMTSVKNITMVTHIDYVWVVTAPGAGFAREIINHEDASYSREAPLGVSKSFPTNGSHDVAPDQWHHLLISWDVTGSISCGGDSQAINSSFKMYYALDDKNYNKGALPADWIGDVDGPDSRTAGSEPNTIVSNDGFLATLPWPASEGSEAPSFSENSVGPGSYSGSIGTLPGKKMFVPGSSHYTDGGRTVNSVYKIEMAELQIFTGVMLDTSDESNRRAFIAPKKKSDDIASTDPSTVDKDKGKLFPVDPKKAEELLGKKPDILLHRNNNWKKGKNTGSIGIDDDGNEISSGQFTPTGTIKKYTPEPSIAAPSG